MAVSLRWFTVDQGAYKQGPSFHKQKCRLTCAYAGKAAFRVFQLNPAPPGG
jgi:hypothetical protein